MCSTFFAKLGVGAGAASFWRGAWYVIDDNLYPDEPVKSAASSLGIGTTGLAASSVSIDAMSKPLSKLPLPLKSAVLFTSVYSLALSNILVWRGTWMLWDLAYESYGESEKDYKATDEGHATRSGMISHSIATGGLFAMGLFASVLAPPAGICIIRDAVVKRNMKYILKAR